MWGPRSRAGTGVLSAPVHDLALTWAWPYGLIRGHTSQRSRVGVRGAWSTLQAVTPGPREPKSRPHHGRLQTVLSPEGGGALVTAPGARLLSPGTGPSLPTQ